MWQTVRWSWLGVSWLYGAVWGLKSDFDEVWSQRGSADALGWLGFGGRI